MEGRAMKRWFTSLGIAAYLTALAFGFVAHAVDYGTDCHPIMYFLVWDMFCGWSGYEGRLQLIGEGESGKFYELAPNPWSEFHPYGFIDRHHYDPNHTNGFVFANNCLKHTKHEPMVRILAIEEEYAKKFNLPDKQFEAYYGKPKQPHSYYQLRYIYSPTGELMQTQPNWFTAQVQMSLGDNPRLVNDAYRNRPFVPSGAQINAHGAISSGRFYEPSSVLSIGAPLAE
jgi:hypothetical protein